MTHPAFYAVTGVIGLAVILISYISYSNRAHSYNNNNKNTSDFRIDNDGMCTICLFDKGPDRENTILNCGHTFHTRCIQPWIRQSSFCPNCRQNLNA